MTHQLDSVLIELHYLPSLEYFASMYDAKELILEANETYQKQTNRNRCNILSSNKVDTLVIPVLGGRNIPIKDVKIDYSQRWSNVHWRAISSAYGRSPFFEYYADYFQEIYEKKHETLFSLNLGLLTLCLKCLQIDLEIKFTENYSKELKNNQNDIRSHLLPQTGFFDRLYYRPIPYPQIFGKDFVANLSIIDLLFCEGPNARVILKQSRLHNMSV